MTVQTYPAPKSQVTSSFWRYTATGGETTLTGIDNAGVSLAYLPGQEQVFLNGVLQVRGTDYTATNGTSITGLASLTAGDYVQVTTYSNFTINQVPASSLQGSILNLQLANSSFTIGSTLINLGDTKSTIAGLTLTAPTVNNQIAGTQYSTSVPLTVKAAAGQAVSLQEWQNSSSSVLAKIDQSGNLGIGTTSPDEKLTIQESGDAQISLKNSSGTTKAYIGTNGAIGSASTDDLRIRSDASNILFGFSGFEKMRIQSDGRITFNTTAYGTLNPGNYTYDFSNAGNWLKGAITTSGSYGGPISMLDGTSGWNIRTQDSGGTMRFGYGTTTSGITEVMQLSNAGQVNVTGSVRAQQFGSTNSTFTLATGASAYNFGRSGLMLVQGGIAGNNFWDLVLQQQYGGLTVLGSATYGSPSTRTYGTGTGGTLQVSLSGGTSGTYTIAFSQFAAS